MPDPVLFNEDDSRRIQKTVKAYENSIDDGNVGKPHSQPFVPYPKIATTTTAIGPGSGSTPSFGHGSAKIKYLTGSGTTPTINTTSDIVSVLNMVGVTIPSGVLVLLIPVDGFWVVIHADCPAAASSGGSSGTPSGASSDSDSDSGSDSGSDSDSDSDSDSSGSDSESGIE